MEPIFRNETDWKGTIFIEEFYESTDFSKIQPITQVQAVTFTDSKNIVLYEHIDGYFSFPGGKVEPNESLEDALKRELIEEMQAEILELKPIGYFKNWKKEEPDKISYNVRYAAVVKLLNETINDPAGKAIGRKIAPVEKVPEILGWGEKGEILVKTAAKMIQS